MAETEQNTTSLYGVLKYPYNKQNNLLGEMYEVAIEEESIAVKYRGVIILKPILDKLVFSFTPKFFLAKTTNEQTEYLKYIDASLKHSAKTSMNGLAFAKPAEVHAAGYNLNVSIQIAGSKSKALLQALPSNPKKDLIRLELNPSHYSDEQLAGLKRAVCDELMSEQGISWREDIIERANVHRADVAIDIVGARRAHMEVIHQKAKKPSKYKTLEYKSGTGRSETTYYGGSKAQQRSLYLYDKRQEQLDKKQSLLYGDAFHTRFESRIQKSDFTKLLKAHNRCKRLSIRALNYRAFAQLAYDRRLVVLLGLSRSLETALKQVPEGLEEQFRQSYNDVLQPIWNPDEIWKYWADCVNRFKISPPEKEGNLHSGAN